MFELIGHAEAGKCFAWAHCEMEKGGSVRLITVLARHLVDSPQKAVRTAICHLMCSLRGARTNPNAI